MCTHSSSSAAPCSSQELKIAAAPRPQQPLLVLGGEKRQRVEVCVDTVFCVNGQTVPSWSGGGHFRSDIYCWERNLSLCSSKDDVLQNSEEEDGEDEDEGDRWSWCCRIKQQRRV